MDPKKLVVGEYYAFERREMLLHPERARVIAIQGDTAEVEIDAPSYNDQAKRWDPGLAPTCRGTVPARCLHSTWEAWATERASRADRNEAYRARHTADRAAAARAVAACARLGIGARPDAHTNEVRVTSTEALAAILEDAANQRGQ